MTNMGDPDDPPDTSAVLLSEDNAVSFCDRIDQAGGAKISVDTAGVEPAFVAGHDHGPFRAAPGFLHERFTDVDLWIQSGSSP